MLWLTVFSTKASQTNTCMLNVLLQATPAVVILGILEMHVGKSTVPHRLHSFTYCFFSSLCSMVVLVGHAK